MFRISFRFLTAHVIVPSAASYGRRAASFLKKSVTRTEKKTMTLVEGILPTPAILQQLENLYHEALENIPVDGVQYKKFLSDVMRLNPHNDIHPTSSKDINALLEAINAFETSNGRVYGDFFRFVIPKMILVAAELPSILPLSKVGHLSPSEVELTKRQCFGILSSGFFCLFPTLLIGGQATSDLELAAINFTTMHLSDVRVGSATVTKLRMFLDYFDTMAKRFEASDPKLDDLKESLRIVRYRLPSVKQFNNGISLPADVDLKKPLMLPKIFPLHQSIDDQLGTSRIDFANRFIGGGSIGYGCVQEEITFTMYPELNVSRLLHSAMDDMEAIALINAERFSSIREGTYGRRTQYGSRYDGPRINNEVIVAVDALMFPMGCLDSQRSPKIVSREICKFIAGLRAIPSDLPETIRTVVSTGNWGCGAFHGDIDVKFLIQWIGCSLEQRTMHYFPWDQQRVVDFLEKAQALVRLNVTCEEMLTFITSHDGDRRPLFQAIDDLLMHRE